MPDKAKRAYPKFDPDGSGYDNRIADELIKLAPLNVPKPKKYEGEVIRDGDSFQAWVWHPELKDYRIHGSSFDPRTGMLLKGKKNKTFHLTKQEETRRRNIIVKREDGRYYSIPDLLLKSGYGKVK